MHLPEASDNPFSTRHVRPGALPFIFPAGNDAEKMIARFGASNWWGEIIGPHGSGKSALLAELIPAIEQTGRTVVLVELHDRQRRLPLQLAGDTRLQPPAVLIIDGYEQLGLWQRWRVKSFCRRRGLGLLVTAHRSVGLSRLHQTAVTADLARQIVDRLTAGHERKPTAEQIAATFHRHDGNLREMLFELYDLYERL